jgi:hypothetical protein
MKSLKSYQTEYNAIVAGLGPQIDRALFVRKQIGKLDGKKFHTEGPTAKALSTVKTTLGTVKTYAGVPFEKNA